MSWNINSNSNSTWTNNATNESIGVVANAIGTSTTTGYKIASSKKLYFGNSQEVNFNYSNSIFRMTYTDPSTKEVKDLIKYNPSTDKTTIYNLNFSTLNLDQATSNASGFPSIIATGGTMIYTKSAAGAGAFYVGV